MYEISIKAKNYKCFKEETGFESIKRVNLIIGKNNSGKSTLLDLVNFITSDTYSFKNNTWRENKIPEIIFESIITKETINKTFSENTSGGDIRGNHNSYGHKYLGRKIKWTKNRGNGEIINSNLIQCDDNGI